MSKAAIGILDLMRQEAGNWAKHNAQCTGQLTPFSVPPPPQLIEDGEIGQHPGHRGAVVDPQPASAPTVSRPAPNAARQSASPKAWSPSSPENTHVTPMPPGARPLTPAHGMSGNEVAKGTPETQGAIQRDKKLAGMLADFDKAMLDDQLDTELFNGPDAKTPVRIAPVAVATVPVESTGKRIPLPPGTKPVQEQGRKAIPLPPGTRGAPASRTSTVEETLARAKRLLGR